MSVAAPNVAPGWVAGYELLAVLGRGTQGTVYRARASDGRLVAIKDLGPLHASERVRLVRATELARAVAHSNVVRLEPAFEYEGRSYLPMELVEGEGVVEWARPGGALEPTRAREALLQLARALAVLHELGLVHRDVKPSNVRVDGQGRVVLLDFGLLAERTFEESRPALGTALYAAPEQLAGDVVGPSADMFSLGVVLFELLFGHLPHTGGDAAQLLRAKSAEPVLPRHATTRVPDELTALCLRLLDPVPDRRPSAREIVRSLSADEQASAARTSSSFPQKRVFVGHRALLAGLAERARAARAARGEAFVVAPPGGGKTALLDELESVLARELADVCVVRCRAADTQVMPWAYAAPLLDALVSHADDAELDPHQRMSAEQLWPALVPLDRTPVLVPLPSDLRERRRLSFEALAAMLHACARRVPLVVACDDIERADADSRALLEQLARSNAAVFWIATSERAGALGGRGPQPTDLPAFDESEAEELLRACIDGLEPSELREAVTFARGNPLALVEWMRAKLAGVAPTASMRSAAELFLARVRTLPDAARRILELVSLAGAPIGRDVLLLASGVGLDAFMGAMATLRASGFVSTSGSAADELVHAPHASFSAALVASLSRELRRERHTSLAAVFAGHERRGHTAGLAHALAAELTEQAAELAERGAELARDRLAYARAAALWEQVMVTDVALRGTAPRARWEQLAHAMALSGQRYEAAIACVQAMQGAPSADQLDWQRRAAANLMHAGALAEAMAATRRMLTNVGLTMANSPAGALPSLLWGRALIALRGSDVRPVQEQQVPKVVLSRLDTLWSAGALLGMADHIIGADVQTRGLRLALKVGEPRRAARALALEAFFQSGHPARGRELVARAASLGRGHPLSEVLVDLARSTIDVWTGSYDAAERGLAAADRRLCTEVADAEWELTAVRDMRILALYCLGRFRCAIEQLRSARLDAAARSDWYGYARITMTWAGVYAMITGDSERAARDLEDAARRWLAPSSHLHHVFRIYSEANIGLYRADERTESRLLESWPALERSQMLRIPVMRVLFFQVRALSSAQAALRAPSEAKRRASAIDADAKRLVATKVAPGASTALLLRATAALVRGDSEAAVRHLSAARAHPTGFGPGLVVSYALGRLTGGEAGQALCTEAEQSAQRDGVADIERLTRMFLPHLP